MNALDSNLPGDPSKLLIRKVRRHLKTYGIIPRGTYATRNHLWRMTWEWAWSVALSYDQFRLMTEAHRRRHRWPRASEIGAQYVALLLAEMRDNRDLKLPYRAADHCPIATRIALAPMAFDAEPKQLPETATV